MRLSFTGQLRYPGIKTRLRPENRMKMIRQTWWKPHSGSSGIGGTAAGTLPGLQEMQSPAAPNVYEIDPLHDPRWASFVEGHPRASVFHTTNWIGALRSVYGYEPVAITTCPPRIPLTNGIVFCRIKSWLTGRRLVSLPFADHCEPLVSNQDGLDCLLLYLRHLVDEASWASATIKPVCSKPGENTNFQASSTYYLHRLDLRKTTEDLFHHFHKDCVQRKIRRAERELLSYEEGTSELTFRKFYKLVVMTRRRHSLPPQPMEWFRGLIEAFGPKLKIRIASKEDVPVAGVLTLSHDKRVVYKYGCSNTRFNNLGGMAFLFWKTIQEAKDNRFEELDMGRSDSDNPGLIAFKDRWGAERILLSYWTYSPKALKHKSIWRETLIRQVVAVAPDNVLEKMGQLLYRHFG